MQTSTTRLENPSHIWLARLLGLGLVLASLGFNVVSLPTFWDKLQHEGAILECYYFPEPDGRAVVVYITAEATQKGVALGDVMLNPEDALGKVGSLGTLRFQRGTEPVYEVSFIRRPFDTTARGAMLFGVPQAASIWLTLFVTLAPWLISGLAALVLCWLKSDDWMALLTAVFLANSLSLYNANPYIIIFQLLMLPVQVAWLLLFPNGRLIPRWSWLLILLLLPSTVLRALFGLGILSASQPYPTATLITDILSALAAIGLLAISVYRYRRIFSPTERQQSKWIILPLIVGLLPSVVLSVLSTYAWNAFQPEQGLRLSFVSFAIMNPIMVGLLVAGVFLSIFRYRLWDIDFLINRSLVYGALTVLLALVFGSSLFLVSRLVQGQNFVLAFGITAVVAGGAFNPVRRRIQRFVDQRFYHIQIDYQKTPLEVPAASSTQVLRTTHFGAYQNLELIGRGGMAEVYKSTHPQLQQPVAIKILPAQLAEEAEFRQRFQREAQVVSQLEHPNIVRVFDSGEVEGQHYMVMEYLTGQDLDKFMRANGRLALDQALPLVQQIAAALDYAHAQGFVHRDIKPSNILLDGSNSQPRAILTDFGIAKILNAHTVMTRTGSVMGTFDYIAPEQIQESPEIDGRADIYALGIMVYQMLTGELPFKQKNSGALLIAHLTQPPPDACTALPDLPAALCNAIQKAMAKKPEDRFATAFDFSTALAAA